MLVVVPPMMTLIVAVTCHRPKKDVGPTSDENPPLPVEPPPPQPVMAIITHANKNFFIKLSWHFTTGGDCATTHNRHNSGDGRPSVREGRWFAAVRQVADGESARRVTIINTGFTNVRITIRLQINHERSDQICPKLV